MARPSIPYSELLEPVAMLRENQKEARKTREFANRNHLTKGQLLRDVVEFAKLNEGNKALMDAIFNPARYDHKD